MKGTGGGLTPGWREDGPEVACAPPGSATRSLSFVACQEKKNRTGRYRRPAELGENVAQRLVQKMEERAMSSPSAPRATHSIGNLSKRTAPHLSDRLCVEEVKGGRLR